MSKKKLNNDGNQRFLFFNAIKKLTLHFFIDKGKLNT